MAGGSLREYRRKRDFGRTAEPEGRDSAGRAAHERLSFVIQKHQASRLHYDLRLEAGGVMKSWAVPKGPSLDPQAKRLALEVEDHPMEYNAFEGTIPEGEYGGGTVMLWDRGFYLPDEESAGDADRAVRRALHRGKLSFWLQGERLQGGWTLVRKGREGDRTQWLLVKQDDVAAERETEATEEFTTSVASGRSMEEIARGAGGARVWRSNRASKPRLKRPEAPRGAAAGIEPMLAERTSRLPEGEGWVYEPKYDGMRVVAYATPEGVALMTRNGIDRARQFPEIVPELRSLAERAGGGVVLDGEVVALGEHGRFGTLPDLQGRYQVEGSEKIAKLSRDIPAAYVAFDLLLLGDEPLAELPWSERRARLEGVLSEPQPHLRLGEAEADGRKVLERAKREGWEGVMAKRAEGAYLPGVRSRDWQKLVLRARASAVVGGWTEPKGGRSHFGSLLLGMHGESGELRYVGHVGTGFGRETREWILAKLRRRARKTSPFAEPPEKGDASWTTPRLVVEVESNGWTPGGKLRQASFVGVREDLDPADVLHPDAAEEASPAEARGAAPAPPAELDENRSLVRALGAAEAKGRDARVSAGGAALSVTNLSKVFFPEAQLTKGDLLRYYAEIAPVLLPRMADRPLVLKRYPDGIDGEAFYQQSAPEEVPEGVRVEEVSLEGGKVQRRLVGGNLATLLYTVQLGAISYDPWHSRLGRLDSADYTILDLDPGPGATFATIVEVAARVKAEMDRFGLHGALKTSGSAGLHIYLPLEEGTPLDAATLVAQILATRVARAHPNIATVERLRKKRPRGTVYVDYLQNILGKTVAGVYAARAKPGGTVSTPLAWDELTPELDPGAFTIRSVPARVRERGDLWAAAMEVPNSLRSLLPGGAA